jgi:hypothetical protein
VWCENDRRPLDPDGNNTLIDFGPPHEKRFSEKKANPRSESAGLVVVSVQDAGMYYCLILVIR